jgi:hypothetical protein
VINQCKRMVWCFVPALAVLIASCGRGGDPAAASKTSGPTSTQSTKAPTITADPNPVPSGTQPGPGKTTVTWSTGNNSFGHVYLSVDGGPEKAFALKRREGKQEAPWIYKNKTYEFRLYSAEPKQLLASVKVSRADNK